jgi:hypothetical protein
VNSGLLRVDNSHRSLLEDWKRLLDRHDYGLVQRMPARERPLHMVSDQDALTALLGSSRHAAIPLHLLKRGVDIAQCAGPSGFTPAERLRSLRRGHPPIVHAVALKPWQHDTPARLALTGKAGMRVRYENLHLRLSPYTIVARAYAGEADVSLEQLSPRNAVERGLLALGARRPQVPELPLAVVDTTVRWVRRRLGIARYTATDHRG